jgi:general secretion pathway protein M
VTESRLAPVKAWWAGLALRERRLVQVLGAALVLLFVVMLLVQPALRTVRSAPAQLDALDADLQSMQRLAAEARELRSTPPVDTAQSGAALKAASDRLGNKAQLVLQNDRAVLTLNSVGTEQLRSWLAEVRSGARARPLEANLTRGAGGYSGSIVVALGGSAG